MGTNQSLILNNLLHICQKDELLYANNERSVLISTAAFGVLQRDLIENIGINRMKAFFFRYGWHLGIEDAKEIAKKQSLSMVEKIEYGPIIHALRGHAKSRITEQDFEMENGKIKIFRYQGVWEESFEAIQHIRNFGKKDSPVCYTLTGYASGYVSSLLGEKVFFKEHQCAGTGAPYCIWEGRLLAEWQEEANEQLYYSKELPILKELEQTNERLVVEKNNMAMVTKIHTQLTAELIKGNNIDAILEIVFQQIKQPVVVEDVHFQVLGLKGITTEMYEPLKKDFKIYSKKNNQIINATVVHLDNGTRLVTPIFLQEKIIGYCSFLYDQKKFFSTYEIDSMIIGRVSSICSMLIINERTKLESMERIKGHFLEEIIGGKYQDQQEIMKKAGYIQLNLSGDYHIVWISYNFTNRKEEMGLTLHHHTFEATSSYFTEMGINVLICQRTDSLILLIPENQLNRKEIQDVIHSLLSYLKRKVKNTIFLAGISSMNSNIIEAVAAVEEARSAARLSTRETPITAFSDLGIIGVLINEQNESAVRKIIRVTLGNLCVNQDQNKIELQETLYNFLINGGNLELTAEHLALSVSGLRYRLNKIMEILGRRDLREPEVQFQMLLALKAQKIMDKES